MKQIAGLVAMLALAACASTSIRDSDAAFLARAELVGLSKSQVIDCAGKPESVETKGEKESLSYSASSGETTLVMGAKSTLLANARHACKVVFVLRRGFVEDVEYVGERTGGMLTPGEECLPIVRKCTGIQVGAEKASKPK